MAMKRDFPESDKRLCGGCGSSERWLLHYIRLRGTFQRLCTNCLLKNHPGLFCPVCLDVFDFDHPPPPRDRVMCVKCPSIAHNACANCASFECPPCSQSSSFSFFTSGGGAAGQLLGKESAKAFVAAAKIAANSMKKAAAAARSDAERRVKEAVAAKKRAREALEVLAFLVSKEKEEKDEKGEMNSGKVEQQKAKSETTNPAAMQVLANLATSMATEGTNGVRADQLQSNDMEVGGEQVKEGA